jgi:ribosomal protein S27AE
MSTQTGKLVTCDRCGATVFLKRTGEGEADGGYTKWDKFDKLPEGWGYEKHKDLCPACNAVFEAFINAFMAGGGEEGGAEDAADATPQRQKPVDNAEIP